jgi:hypothetical protein
MSAVDSLRLAVARVVDDDLALDDGIYSVEVFVNDVELTSRGAGLGMDPYDLLVPQCTLHAEPRPKQVTFARCGCGMSGCDSTKVVVRRDRDVVRWDWVGHRPLDRPALFRFEDYEAEIVRAEADHSWEPPERAAGRLVLERIASRALPDGVVVEGFSSNWDDDNTTFVVALFIEDIGQVRVAFPWNWHDPRSLADKVVTTLVERPRVEWTARYFDENSPGTTHPPRVPGTWIRWRPSMGRPF